MECKELGQVHKSS